LFWIGETLGETLGVQILMVSLLVAAKRTVPWCFDCFGWRLCWSDENGSVFYLAVGLCLGFGLVGWFGLAGWFWFGLVGVFVVEAGLGWIGASIGEA